MAYTINNDETELTIGGKTYVTTAIIEHGTCKGCCFKGLGNNCKAPCVPHERKDGKEVIWKLKTEQMETAKMTPIPTELYKRLVCLGIIDPEGVRDHNVGNSNYSEHLIQPWSVWLDYPELTPWDDDIIKRVLRTKEGDSRKMDYEKIIHICEERIRQLKNT